MKEIIITIAKVLLSKNIAFCLYRLPSESSFRLAVDEQYLPHEKDVLFRITPFTKQSKAGEFFLSVVKEDFIKEVFLEKLTLLPAEEEFHVDLPEETTKEEYFDKIKKYLKDIRDGKLDKAILSRVVYAERAPDFEAVDCFTELSKSYPQTFTYVLSHPKSGLWLGATPELLLKQREKDVFTVALAGTQKRREKGEYNWRVKEIEEHEWVGKHIEWVFEKEGYVLAEKKSRKTIESGPVAHLETGYIFRDEKEKPDMQGLVEKLHPTPAIGGWPVAESLACIQAYEKYDRTYYAGIMGETDLQQHSDLYINLRCMQVGKEKIAIYVGGGITSASDPQEEWEETCIKSRTMGDKIIALRK